MNAAKPGSPGFRSIGWMEEAINRVLDLDPEALREIGRMQGKVFAVDLTGVGQTIYVLPDQSSLRLCGHYEGDVHVRIRGTPMALLRMAAHREANATATFNGDIEIVGDLALARHLQATLASLHVDWEELVSHYVGDIVAHQLGNVGRGFRRWAQSARRTARLNTVEYLRNELSIVPDAAELDRFMNAVDNLRMDVDRLDARIARLRNHRSADLQQ